jgi:hypothetical protein
MKGELYLELGPINAFNVPPGLRYSLSCGHDHHNHGFINKGSCHIPFSYPKRNCSHSEFRLRLAGLTGNLNFHLLKRIGCDVELTIVTGEKISGEMCHIGIDFIEIKKFDQKTIVTILKDTISTINWLDENCASAEEDYFPSDEQNECNGRGDDHQHKDGHDQGNHDQHDNFNVQRNDFHHARFKDKGYNDFHGYFDGQNDILENEDYHGHLDNLLNPTDLTQQTEDFQTLIDEHGKIIYEIIHNDDHGYSNNDQGTSQQDADQEESSSSSSSS